MNRRKGRIYLCITIVKLGANFESINEALDIFRNLMVLKRE